MQSYLSELGVKIRWNYGDVGTIIDEIRAHKKCLIVLVDTSVEIWLEGETLEGKPDDYVLTMVRNLLMTFPYKSQLMKVKDVIALFDLIIFITEMLDMEFLLAKSEIVGAHPTRVFNSDKGLEMIEEFINKKKEENEKVETTPEPMEIYEKDD
jgi:hypothetical protein